MNHNLDHHSPGPGHLVYADPSPKQHQSAAVALLERVEFQDYLWPEHLWEKGKGGQQMSVVVKGKDR